MAIDRKYGRVTVERGTIGKNEKVFVLRAQDALVPALLQLYAAMCRNEGSPESHIMGVLLARDDMIEWQRTHHTQVPRSDPPEGV